MRRSRHYRKKRSKTGAGPKSVPIETRQAPALAFHVRKVQAQLIVDEGVGRPKLISQAVVVLNEVTPKGVSLFSEIPFALEQQITLNIPQLRNFFVKGHVVGCKELNLNPGVLSERSYRFRVQLAYDFRSEQERRAVQEYCEYLSSEFLEVA